MKSLISVPEEIVQFLSQKDGVSLMVKGAPGTGKSILVLSIIKVLGLTESFYLTTRVKPQKLVSDLPWIRDILPCEHIIDATTTIIPTKADVEGKISFGLLKYADKPSLLRSLYELIEKVENPFIVIDSIEAIQRVAGEEIFSDLLNLCRELNSKVIFVSEYEETRKYDYLVDGVILLKRYIIEGKTLRFMQIEKLRGISCRNPQYLFTLHAG
ncbi:MAG: ATPase domain-containing protein [Candidatus Jordarchaeaceae archaeon]